MQVSGANLQDTAPWGGSKSLGSVLLEPTVIYVKRLLALIEAVNVKVSGLYSDRNILSTLFATF